MTKKHMLEEYPRVARERDNLAMAMHDWVNDKIVWGKWIKEEKTEGNSGRGKCRVGICDRMMPLAVVLWSHPAQSDNVRVYELESYKEEVRRARVHGGLAYDAPYMAVLDAEHTLRATKTGKEF